MTPSTNKFGAYPYIGFTCFFFLLTSISLCIYIYIYTFALWPVLSVCVYVDVARRRHYHTIIRNPLLSTPVSQGIHLSLYIYIDGCTVAIAPSASQRR